MVIRRHRSGRFTGSWEQQHNVDSVEGDVGMEVITDSDGDNVAVMEEEVDPTSIEEKTRVSSRKRKNISEHDQENGEAGVNEDVSEIRKKRKTGEADVDVQDENYGIVTEGVRESTTSITSETQAQLTQQSNNAATIPSVQSILTERTESLVMARTTNTVVGSSVVRQHVNASPTVPSATQSTAPTTITSAVPNAATSVRDRIDPLAAPRRRTRPIPDYVVKNYQAMVQNDTDLTPKLNEMRQVQDAGRSEQERQRQPASRMNLQTILNIFFICTMVAVVAALLYERPEPLPPAGLLTELEISSNSSQFVTSQDLAHAIRLMMDDLQSQIEPLNKLHSDIDQIQTLRDDVTHLHRQIQEAIQEHSTLVKNEVSQSDIDTIRSMEERMAKDMNRLAETIQQLQSSADPENATKHITEQHYVESDKQEERIREIRDDLRMILNRMTEFVSRDNLDALKTNLSDLNQRLDGFVVEQQNNNDESKMQSQVQGIVKEKMMEELKPLSERLHLIEHTLNRHLTNVQQDESIDSALSIESMTGLRNEIARLVQEFISADIIGKPDFALHSMGSKIISHSPSYRWRSSNGGDSFGNWLIQQFGHGTTNPPNTMLTSDMSLGNCWAFDGAHGFVLIRLPSPVAPDSFSVDHIHRSIAPNIGSAPRLFTVRGFHADQRAAALVYAEELIQRIRSSLLSESLKPQNAGELPPKVIDRGQLLAEFEYKTDGQNVQTFHVSGSDNKPFLYFLVEVLDNHGADYTCIYRFRIHA